MSFDAGWFHELRGLSEEKLQVTRERGIEPLVPQVGELCRDEYLSVRFVEETEHLVRLLDQTPYRFAAPFRAYERHIANFPKGRAFRKQWNIAFTAGEVPGDDHVRIGIGFRLTEWDNDYMTGIEEYLEFREQVRLRAAAFDGLFHGLGDYCEIDDKRPSDPSAATSPGVGLSRIVIADNPWPECWRFFGRRLMVRNPKDHAVIRSHERLRDAAVDVFERIQRAGFGM
jgi:hypothetical protein